MPAAKRHLGKIGKTSRKRITLHVAYSAQMTNGTQMLGDGTWTVRGSFRNITLNKLRESIAKDAKLGDITRLHIYSITRVQG